MSADKFTRMAAKGFTYCGRRLTMKIERDIAEFIRWVVREEREACAKEADKHSLAAHAAQAIRARTPEADR
jgi:hypothetical protein